MHKIRVMVPSMRNILSICFLAKKTKYYNLSFFFFKKKRKHKFLLMEIKTTKHISTMQSQRLFIKLVSLYHGMAQNSMISNLKKKIQNIENFKIIKFLN